MRRMGGLRYSQMHKYFESNMHIFKKISNDASHSITLSTDCIVVVWVQTQASSTLTLAKFLNLFVLSSFIKWG